MNKMTSTASVVAAVLAVILGVSRAATGADHDPVQAQGFVTDNGVTTDGRHSIAVSMTTALALGTPPHDSPGLEQAHAANTLVQNALCEVAR